MSEQSKTIDLDATTYTQTLAINKILECNSQTKQLSMLHEYDENHHIFHVLMRAVEKNNHRLVETILDMDSELINLGTVPLLFRCVSKGMMGLLVRHGADVNATASFGRTPMTWAAQHGKIDSIKMLIDHGVRVPLEPDASGKTPLQVALYFGNADFAQMLHPYLGERDLAIVKHATSLAWACHSDRRGMQEVASVLQSFDTIKASADALAALLNQ